MTTTTMTPEKYEALRRSGQVPAAELPEVLRCETYGHIYSLDWMDAYPDRAHAERVKARLLALVATTCLTCIDWRRGESAAWIEANSVRYEIKCREEKQQQAARAAAEQARRAAATPQPLRAQQSRRARALANAVERPFDFSGI